MIDLKKFTHDRNIFVPIVDGWGAFRSRKFYFPETENGYYEVGVIHDTPEIIRPATQLESQRLLEPCKKLKVYSIGEEGVPTNFETLSKKGFGESVKINFLNLDLFEVAEVVLWEDKRFYFYDTKITKQKDVVRLVKESFRKEEGLSEVRGVTPELRYCFLLANLQRQSIKAAEEFEKLRLSREEREKQVRIFQRSFGGRLTDTISKAGGTLIRYNKHGNGYLVEWSLGGQTIKSNIRDNLRIINAGFCLDGDDKKHSVASIINLAKLFQEDSPLYITRE